MRTRRGIGAVVAAALAVTLAGATSSAGADEPSAAERDSWTAEERAAYGEESWPEVEAEEVVAAADDERRPPAVAEPGAVSPEVGTELPEAGAVTVAVPEPGAEPESADAGGLPVEVAAPEGAEATVSEVTVDVLPAEVAEAAALDGVVLRLDTPATEADDADEAPVEIRLDYSGFAGRFGGDWAERVEIVALPDCAADDPANPECWTPEPVASANDPQAATVTATVAPRGVFALAAAPGGSTGNWGATPLAPSASWNVSEQTGSFTWAYPLRTPPAPGGLEPELSLGYSAASVDGRVTSTNNQSSWVGEGWDLSTGYVERSYVPCADDMAGGNNATRRTGDLCWKTDNAVLVLGGQSTRLVKDAATGIWRAEDDDNSRIERFTGGWNADNDGEYWRVTTTDGTQYFFGRGKRSASDPLSLESAWTVPVFGNHPGEPCYAASFAASRCSQAWRWNLDYVVDAQGNSMTYTYARETNNYAPDLGSAAVAYDRGGYLTSVLYGTRAGAEAGNAPLRVDFTVAERCLPGATDCSEGALTAATAKYWPDVPFDLLCTGSTCTQHTPTFFTRKRLTTVTTKVLDGGSYRAVDTWTLEQQFPDPGDSTSRVLWLSSVGQTGVASSPQVALPRTTFIGAQMANRVDALGDHAPPMNRYRIIAINSDTGSTTSVNYTPQDCTPTSLPASPWANDRRCIPVYWTPEGSPQPVLEYFHRYLVASIVSDGRDRESVPIETYYSYEGAPAWRYDDSPLVLEKYRTWSDFRGYATVDVYTGAPTTAQLHTRYRFFRGMDGNRAGPGGGAVSVAVDGIADHDRLNGFLRQETTYDGAAVVETSLHVPWLSPATATGADGRTGRYVASAVDETQTVAPALPGGQRVIRVSTTYDDATGVPVRAEDLGDVAVAADDRCTRVEYVYNAAAHIQLPSRSETVAKPCGVAPSRPADVIADSRTLFDGGAFGVAPTRGLPTSSQSVKSYDGGAPVYLTTATTAYDALGRPVSVTDALGRTSTTAYAPAMGPVTSVTSTLPDPDGSGPLSAHVTVRQFDPAFGVPVKETDPNGKVTTASYDALGRVTQVWLPGRAQGSKSPNVRYSYLVQASGANSVTTERLGATENYLTSVTLYDGLLRERQAQSVSRDRKTPGRIVVDTVYDSRGLAIVANSPWFTSGSPGQSIVVPQTAVPGRTVTEFDGAGRPTAQIFQVAEQERWRTSTSYGGDRVTVVPPSGGVPSTTIMDGRGQTVEARQYTEGSLSGAFTSTSYAYDAAGRLAGMTDAAGNTWSSTYDLLGRKVSSTDPDRGTVTSVYDDGGQPVSSTDARGVTLASVYDGLGRRTELREGSVSGTLRSAWVYDTVAKGLVSSSTRYEGDAAYTVAVTGYDDGYRPLEQQVTIPSVEGALAGTYSTKYTYTVDGQVRTYTNSAVGSLKSELVQTNYDAVSMPERMLGAIGWGVYVSGSQYSPYGEPLLIDAGSNFLNFINYSYEHGTRRLEKMWLLREGAAGYDLDLSYAYDQAGNVLSIADDPVGGGAETQCFAYDGLARLTQAWTPASRDCAGVRDAGALGGPAPYWTSYGYDAVGNRTSVVEHTAGGDSTSTYEYPAAGQAGAHAVSRVATSGAGGESVRLFEYDASGNMTVRGGAEVQELAWDAEGRLSSVEAGGESVGEFVYSADGDRLIRREGGTATAYLPGGQEARLAGGVVSGLRYYSFAGRTVVMRTASGASKAQVVVGDHHGSGQLQLQNYTNQIVSRRYMDPFGNERAAAGDVGVGLGAAGRADAWVGDHGFLDKPLDASGLTQVGARYYDASLGKFISVDPIIDLADPQQWAPYSYANNNPTTLSDPSGLKPVAHDGGVAGASKARKTSIGNSKASVAKVVSKPTANVKSSTRASVKSTKATTPTLGAGGGGRGGMGASIGGKPRGWDWWDDLVDNSWNAMADTINAIASFGNSMWNNPGATLAFVGGIAVGVYGGFVIVGSAIVCATGVGCVVTPGGVVAGVALIGTGAALSGMGSTTLWNEANGASRIDPVQRRGGSGGSEGTQEWPSPSPSGCEEAASEIQGIIGGEIGTVKSPANSLGPSSSDPAGQWNNHVFVVRNNRAYDAFTGPNGMSLSTYKQQWDYSDALIWSH